MSPPKKKSRKSSTALTAKPSARHEEALFVRVVSIIEAARRHVTRSVNSAMVHAYWMIGREIVEVEQHGMKRAGYGDELLTRLAKHLSGKVGKGFGARTLRRIRQFYITYPQGSSLPPELGGPAKRTAALSNSGRGKIRTAVLTKSPVAMEATFPPNLGWAHYLVLSRVSNAAARAFYEIEATREGWSSRELERQVASLLFERLAKSRNKEKVLALARAGHQVESPADVLKDPFVLEFLGLDERAEWRERELEQAIIDRIEAFDRHQRAEHEANTIGIVLCSEKNDAMVKITLPENNKQILAARYQMYLPTEEELRAEIAREREEAERALQLASAVKGTSDGEG